MKSIGILPDKLAISAISLYQRFISPHKGFSCAYRVLYGGESCSQFFKRSIATEGLLVAIVNRRDRFAACHEANQILHHQILHHQILPSQTNDPEEKDEKTPQRNYDCVACPDLAELSCNLIDCASADCRPIDCSHWGHIPDCSALDCSALDCSALDCSALDCSALDCSALDCGSCGG
jgi:putative component of membrane protein insertase Oxa1/YidC/SpoIIIJ protein YidD